MKKNTILIVTLIITLLIGINLANYSYASGHTAGEIVREAGGFISKGANGSELISTDNLKKMSDTIYNILLVVGIILAIIIGLVLGMKFITEGAEGKAEVQKALIAYVIGCVVIFGAFAIWKFVVTVLKGM